MYCLYGLLRETLETGPSSRPVRHMTQRGSARLVCPRRKVKKITDISQGRLVFIKFVEAEVGQVAFRLYHFRQVSAVY